MTPQQAWDNLHKVHQLTPRELYDDEEMDDLLRVTRRYVNDMAKSEMRRTLSVFIRDEMLSDAALDRGEGWEEVLHFLDWIDGGME